MKRINLPRKLLLKLIASVVCAFLATMAITWVCHVALSDRNAMKVINRVLDDVQGEIETRVNHKLIMTAMVVRDRLPELEDTSSETLRKLAEELRVDDVCVVDEKGILVASAHPHEIGFDFHNGDGQAKDFLVLLSTETEFCQPLRPSSAHGEDRKYVGVWLPEGGFVQVGILKSTLRVFAQSAISGLTHNRHVGGVGTIVITTEQGQILSDAKETGLEGSVLQLPENAYVVKRVIEGFDVYAILPKAVAASERNMLVGASAIMTILALFFVAILVGIAISRFVKEQVEKRLSADMEMAKTIQEGCLPSVFPPFPELVDKIDIFAFMRTAREVGGDFYDFFFAGPNHLALVIADVSGKGVPAAMFMMRAKTTIRGHLESDRDIGAAMMKVNDLLAEGNDSNMFVTAWVGVIDIETGMVKYVNAGHNPPLVSRNDGSVEWIKDRSGLTLAAMSGIKYRVKTMKLAPGESIFLYTDGVTEATDMEEKLFGEKRLETEIASTQADVKNRCDQVLKSIDDYQGLAPQADDITMLGFTLKTIEKTFPVVESSLGESADWMSEVFASPKPAIIVDEIVSNIVRCSGATKFTIQIRGNSEIVITDDGRPFDPTALPDPDVTLKAEDRKIGGLGLFLVKKMSKSVEYSRIDTKNSLRVVLK